MPPDLLAHDPRLPALWSAVQARMTTDAAHDAGHLTRVARWTLRLAPDVPALALAAALTHDLVNLPKDHPNRARASELSAQAAQELLLGLGFSGADAVARAVRDHSYSRGVVPQTALGEALQDADRLDALGAVGALRCAAVGGRLGRALLDAADPWASERPLDDARYTLDHFFTKLLKLPASFRTPAGRAEAERRAAAMRALLAQLAEEIGVALPRNV